MISFSIPFTTIPKGARVFYAGMQYGFTAMCTVEGMGITDDYGSVANGNLIVWGPGGLTAINAVIASSGAGVLHITARCDYTCSSPPPHNATLASVGIDVWYQIC